MDYPNPKLLLPPEAAEGKIKEGPHGIITIGFVAKFYLIWIFDMTQGI